MRYVLIILFYFPISSFAATSGSLIWETYLSKIANSLTGPVAFSITVIGIAVSGMVMMFTDLQMGAKKLVTVGLGGGISVFAVQIFFSIVGVSGAVI